MANIKKTPQYLIYLRVLDAVKRGGYEIRTKNKWQSIVYSNNEGCGLIFVVKPPIDKDNLGCLLTLLIPPTLIDMINDFSHYVSMLGAEEKIKNGRRPGKVYWPDNSLVGCYTTDYWGFNYDDSWMRIVRSVI